MALCRAFGVGVGLLALASLRPGVGAAEIPAGDPVASPRALHPAHAVINDAERIPIAVTGSGFGAPDASSVLEVQLQEEWVSVESTAACPTPADEWCIVGWTDKEIVATLSASAHAARVRVQTAHGSSEVVPVLEYGYDWFETNAPSCVSGGTNPLPVAVAVDGSGCVWINEEFHRDLKMLCPASGAVAKLPLGHPAVGPFASLIGGDRATATSQAGEDVLVDPRGRVWWSEGGCCGCESAYPDHSRIVMHDPASGETRVYNVPGNANGVIGLAYQGGDEGGHDRVWFTQLARGTRGIRMAPAQLVWFDPERAPYDDGTFDFAVPMAEGCGDRTCPGPDPVSCADDADCSPACEAGSCPDGGACSEDAQCLTCCFTARRCPAPLRCRDGTGRACLGDQHCVPVCGPGICPAAREQRCFVDADCSLASQACAGTADAPDCVFHRYDLPAGVYMPGHAAVAADGSVWFTAYWGTNSVGRLDPRSGRVDLFPLPPSRGGPPELVWLGSAPWEIVIAANGDVVVSEYADSTISRLDVRRVGDPACQQLSGEPPALVNPCITTLDVPVGSTASYALHSLAFDRRRNLWFTQGGPRSDPRATTSLGYVKADWSAIVMLPGLSVFPFFSPDGLNCPPDSDAQSALAGRSAGADLTAGGLDANLSWFLYPDRMLTPGLWLATSAGFPHDTGEPNEPGNSAFRSFQGSGIAIDGATDDIWFGDFCRKRLGRLRPLWTNLALGQPALQSTTLERRDAGLATDGNIEGDAARGSVAETLDGWQSWWEVDLGKVWSVDQVEIWSRTDCCTDVPLDLYVLASDEPLAAGDLGEAMAQPGVTTRHYLGPPDRPIVLNLGRSARHLRVQQGGSGSLALAEVVVLGGAPSTCDAASAPVACDDANPCTVDSCRFGRCEPRCRVDAGDNSRCVVDPTGCACASCAGDCDCDGAVRAEDLQVAVRIALDGRAPSECPGLDGDDDGRILVHELLTAVRHALGDCPAATASTDARSG